MSYECQQDGCPGIGACLKSRDLERFIRGAVASFRGVNYVRGINHAMTIINASLEAANNFDRDFPLCERDNPGIVRQASEPRQSSGPSHTSRPRQSSGPIFFE